MEDQYRRYIKRLEAENARLRKVLEATPTLPTVEYMFDAEGELVCLGDIMVCTHEGHECEPFEVDIITLGQGARIAGEYVDQSDRVWGVPANWCRHYKGSDAK